MPLTPVAAIEYLEAARTFAGNHRLGVTIAKLNLSNRPGGCIDLPKNDRRSARRASRCSARRWVATSENPKVEEGAPA
jgi:hypothetical protein